MEAHEIKSLEDAKIWAAEHDASVNAWWRSQWKWNIAMEERIKTMERRLYMIVGIAVTAGTTVAQIIIGLVGR